MEYHPEKFRHKYPVRIRFHHVDRMNVVHNLWYFYFFEEARVEFLRALGMTVDEGTFVAHDRFFIVRNACDYFAPVFFDDEIQVLTRIVFVRNSSIGFEHAAVKADSTLAALAEHVFVHVDLESNRPTRVPDRVRDLIRKYEGENVEIVEA